MGIKQVTNTGTTQDNIKEGWDIYNALVTALLTQHDSSGAHKAAADVILKALFDANTILAANSDDTPAALTIAQQRLVGRITGGNIAALTAAQIRTLLNVEDGAAADQTGLEIVTLLEALAGADKLDADAIEIADAGSIITATGVEAALQEIMTDLDAAEADIDGFPDELKNLVTHEIQQLETLGPTTTISATQWGYLGALTADPIGGDGTAGRFYRTALLLILNATTASEIKCQVQSIWNGDAFAETDDIGKGETKGNFTLSANGTQLNIEAAGLSGNALSAFSVISNNDTGTAYTPYVSVSGNDIIINIKNLSGNNQDLTALVDTGALFLNIAYITDA